MFDSHSCRLYVSGPRRRYGHYDDDEDDQQQQPKELGWMALAIRWSHSQSIYVNARRRLYVFTATSGCAAVHWTSALHSVQSSEVDNNDRPPLPYPDMTRTPI